MNTLASVLEKWHSTHTRHVAIRCLKRMMKGHAECEQAVLFATNVATEYEQIRRTQKNKLSPNQTMELVNKYDKELSPYAYAVAHSTLAKLWRYGPELTNLITEYYQKEIQNLNTEHS